MNNSTSSRQRIPPGSFVTYEQLQAMEKKLKKLDSKYKEAVDSNAALAEQAMMFKKQATKYKHLLSTSTTYRGRNKTKKTDFDGLDHVNMQAIRKDLGWKFLPHHKFPSADWREWLPNDEGSFCVRMKNVVDFPDDEDALPEVYWEQGLVPLVNKYFCEWRSNVNNALKISFLGNVFCPPGYVNLSSMLTTYQLLHFFSGHVQF